jgi:hypothetical protein
MTRVSCVVRLAVCEIAAGATDVRDELSLLAALAEYLPIRPGITEVDKTSAVKASVASAFFIILSFTLSEY